MSRNKPVPPAVYASELRPGDVFRFASPQRDQSERRVLRLACVGTNPDVLHPIVEAPLGAPVAEYPVARLAHVVVLRHGVPVEAPAAQPSEAAKA